MSKCSLFLSLFERRREGQKERAALISHGRPGWVCVIEIDGPHVTNTHSCAHTKTILHFYCYHTLYQTRTHTMLRKHFLLWETVEAGYVLMMVKNLHFITKTRGRNYQQCVFWVCLKLVQPWSNPLIHSMAVENVALTCRGYANKTKTNLNSPDGALQISTDTILLKYLLHWLGCPTAILASFWTFLQLCILAG